MIANLPDPLGLPPVRSGRSPRRPRLRPWSRLRVAMTWHGISRLLRDPLWKVGTTSLLAVPLLGGIYQANGGSSVVMEPSRFPVQSAALFVAGLASAMASAVFRIRCPTPLKEQVRPTDYAAYRPYVVDALRADVIHAFEELMWQVTLGPEHAAGERLRGRTGEAALIEGLLAQGYAPVRYGYGSREIDAVQELVMRVAHAAGLPAWVRFGHREAYERVTPDLGPLPGLVHLNGSSLSYARSRGGW